jgi:regulator of RNase E activity RraB
MMREIFHRETDDSFATIEVEIDGLEDREKYPWLLSVFIKFDSLDDEDSMIEEFLELKESLIITLELQNSKYVGMRVVDGWSEFYFYTSDSRGFETIVSDALKHTNYVFESSIVRDSKWNFYHKELQPTELEIAMIDSKKIIYDLIDEDDSLETPREVEHYVVFDTQTQKERFLENILKNGFKYKDDISTDDYGHGVVITKEHHISMDELKNTITEIFETMKKEHGYYEGWSTTLVSKQEI